MDKNKITKNDLVDNIYKNIQDKSVERQTIMYVVDEFLASLKSSIENCSTIELRGFGTFEARLRKGREVARNPKTGAKVSVDPHYVAAFRAGKELKNNLLKIEVSGNEKK